MKTEQLQKRENTYNMILIEGWKGDYGSLQGRFARYEHGISGLVSSKDRWPVLAPLGHWNGPRDISRLGLSEKCMAGTASSSHNSVRYQKTLGLFFS